MGLKTIGVRETIYRVAARNPMTRTWHLLTITERAILTATKGWRRGSREKVEKQMPRKPWLVSKMPRERHLGDEPLLRFEESFRRS